MTVCNFYVYMFVKGKNNSELFIHSFDQNKLSYFVILLQPHQRAFIILCNYRTAVDSYIC